MKIKNLLDKVITFFCERRLRHFCFDPENFKNKEFENYEKYLPIIKEHYKDAFYWHGTGRYHYPYGKQTEIIEDKLDLIINNGIIPRMDAFVILDEETKKETVSLSNYRIYARCYAEVHQYEKDSFLYEYGSLKFWLRFMFLLQFIEIMRNKPIKNYFRRLSKIFENDFSNDVKKWLSTIRNDFGDKKISILNISLRGHKIRSNIPNNYGLLFGIKKEGVSVFHFDKAVEVFETRSDKSILLKDITHIEVPLNKVKETEEFLKQKNISLQVIPLEYGEIYCNDLSFQELI